MNIYEVELEVLSNTGLILLFLTKLMFFTYSFIFSSVLSHSGGIFFLNVNEYLNLTKQNEFSSIVLKTYCSYIFLKYFFVCLKGVLYLTIDLFLFECFFAPFNLEPILVISKVFIPFPLCSMLRLLFCTMK